MGSHQFIFCFGEGGQTKFLYLEPSSGFEIWLSGKLCLDAILVVILVVVSGTELGKTFVCNSLSTFQLFIWYN